MSPISPFSARPRTRRALAGLAVLAAGLTTIVTVQATTVASAQPRADASRVSPTSPIPRGWPRPRTTGPRGDLRSVDGHTITRDGAVLENVEVQGTLTIRADDVTIRNVRVNADSYYGILVEGEGTVIQRTSVVGVNRKVMAGISVEGSARIWRAEVRDVEDGIRLADRSSVRRSLIHRLRGDSGSHYDAVTADGYTGWRIVHNTILNPHTQTAAVWVGDPRYAPSAGVLRDNYIAGGGYTIYAGHGTGKGIRVVDNLFSTRYYRSSGYWGVSSSWESSRNTWSGNRWADGRRKGRRVRP
jgi:hypothetical protein